MGRVNPVETTERAAAVTPPASRAAPSRASIILALGTLACTVLLLPRLLQFAQISFTFIAWPWQFDYTEGVNLNATHQLAGGHNIYRHEGPDSFLSAPYPPLFYLLNAPFAWLSGPSFGPGRAFSLLSTLAIAVLLAYIVKRATSEWPAGLLAGALWLSLSPVIVWSALYTQHIMALAFGLAGLAWCLHYPAGRRVYIGAILFALAFFTKQSAIDAAAATTLWLLLRDRRAGLRFALALLGSIVVPFVGADLLLRGGMWQHVFGNHALPWGIGRFTRILNRLLEEYWPILIWGIAASLAALASVAGRWREGEFRQLARTGGGYWGLAMLYFAVAIASMLARLGREGVNYNHLIDGLLPACLLVGLSAGWLAQRARGREWRRAAMGGLLLGGLLIVQLLLFKDPHTWYRGVWPSPERDADLRNVSMLVGKTAGNIYSEDTYLLLSNGHRNLYANASAFGPLADLGQWDSSKLTAMMRERRFQLALIQHDSERMPRQSMEAFLDNYSLLFRSDIDIYAPKPSLTPSHPLQCILSGSGDTIQLGGYSLSAGVEETGVRGGQTLEVTLYWQPQGKIGQSYASYVQVLNEGGERIAAQDNPQTGAGQPTNEWEPGKPITDTAGIPLPTTLPAGKYRLLAGMYRLDNGTLRAFPATCQAGETYGEAVTLGWIEAR